MSGEANCKCGRDLALMCRECDMDVCSECLQLPKARARIAALEAVVGAVRDWDALFVWDEPFEGYDEEKALHRALAAHGNGDGGRGE